MSIEPARGDGSDWLTEPLIEWLFTNGRRLRDPAQLVTALGDRLIAAGAGLNRIRFSALTLHPLIRGWSVTWTASHDPSDGLTNFLHGIERSSAYLGSPIQHLHRTGQIFRRKLVDLQPDLDHSFLFDQAATGSTDYLAVPAIFSDETVNAVTFSTDRVGGFTDHDLACLIRLTTFLTPILEVAAVRRNAVSLLETYIGRRAGRRVLDGLIKRGDGERITAAIWYSDLRDFTRYTETLPQEAMLEMLNDYFGSVSSAVTLHGGEVLDYIGDAMLIAFPIEDGRSLSDVCTGAVAAAVEAFATTTAINTKRIAEGAPTLSFGVGLDAGEVVIGNVGAPDRLNFAVRGPAVNRSARIESLTKELGYPLLVSAAVQQHLPNPVCALGRYEVKGISAAIDVFAPNLNLCNQSSQ